MKIDLENKYFHGLAGGIPFWNETEIIEMGLKQLRQIEGRTDREIVAQKIKNIIRDYDIPITDIDGNVLEVCKKKISENNDMER